MVKDHSDSERRNPLPPHGLLFPINSKGFFYMHHPTDRIAHTTAFVTPVVEHWLEWEIAQWVHLMKDRSDDLSHHEQTLLPRSYISLLENRTDANLYVGADYKLATWEALSDDDAITDLVTDSRSSECLEESDDSDGDSEPVFQVNALPRRDQVNR